MRFSVDMDAAREAGALRELDLTDAATAKEWGYAEDYSMRYDETIALSERAQAQGYNVIKYNSLRAEGVNYAFLDNFDFDRWMVPESVVPVP